MARQILFFYIPDMEDVNNQARNLIRELKDIVVEEVPCEPSMRRMATCPFIRDETGKGNHYGIPGIESFLQDLHHEKSRENTKRRKRKQRVVV